MNDNLQYKSRNELEQLCKQFNIDTLGLKKEDLLLELRRKLLWVNDLPRSPHRPHRSAEGITSSKKKRSAHKALSKSASMGRTVSHLEGQFEEQAAPAWQHKVVSAVPGLEEDNVLQDGAETPKVDLSGVPVVKKAVLLNSMENKDDLEGGTVPTEEVLPDTEVTEPARLERRLSYSEAGETNSSYTLAHSASENNLDAESDVEPASEPPFEESNTTTRIESPDTIIEDKEMVHHDSVLESLESNWSNNAFSPLHSVSSMTVEVGDVPASETLSVLSEADDDASKFELDISNDLHSNDNVDLDDDFIEFKIVDSADVYKSLMEDKQLLHGAQNMGSMRTTVIEKSPSRLHSMNSMFVEIGDNPAAESDISGPSEAEDRSSYHDLDNFDGYEVTVVEDGAAPPLKGAGEIVPAEQFTPPESGHTNGEVPNYEVSTDATSEPENTLGDFVQDAHEGSRTTFVSEWAANNLSLPTLISDKESGTQSGGESSPDMSFPMSVVLWCSQSCSRLPGNSGQPKI